MSESSPSRGAVPNRGKGAQTSSEVRASDPASDDPLSPSASPGRPPQVAPPGADGDAIELDITLQTTDCQPPLDGWLEPQLRRALAAAAVTAGRLSVVVVDDAVMTELHVDYRQEDGTTDVLTFDLREDEDDPLEGEIVICLEEASRRAAELGHPVRHEVLLYAVHGVMHLLGEDDHDPEAFERMHTREDAVLSAIGVGPVFGQVKPGLEGGA